ncbi:hypothetical protein ABZ960_41760, partial [Streptomyces pseudovenezuelae]|uniref:hypothetical protein n=1 Tax=Streptomyces pseudovenezuelae TaxID=67350 RepID=UPI0034A4D086
LWTVAATALLLTGAPYDTVRTLVKLALSPMWCRRLQPPRGAGNCATSHDGPAPACPPDPVRGAGNCATGHDVPALAR